MADSCAHAAGHAAPVVIELHVFGSVLDADPELDRMPVAFVVDLPASDVAWYAEPPAAQAWAHVVSLHRYPVEYYYRPAGHPVANHYVQRPVSLWTHAGGLDEKALACIAAGRGAELRRPPMTPAKHSRQLRAELALSRAHLDDVVERYYDRGWRQDHRGDVRWDDHLWRATYGHLDVLRAVEALDAS